VKRASGCALEYSTLHITVPKRVPLIMLSRDACRTVLGNSLHALAVFKGAEVSFGYPAGD